MQSHSKVATMGSRNHTRALLKQALLRRLAGMGVEEAVIPGVVRSLGGVYRYDRTLSTYEANHRLKFLGWSDIELDHYTWLLAVDFFSETAAGPLGASIPRNRYHLA